MSTHKKRLTWQQREHSSPVVSQSGTLIRQSINVQITFDDTCHVVYIVTNNKRLFSFKYVRISVLHYHPTSYACAFAHTHVHDRKTTFSHKTYVHTRYRYACTWQKENILSWNVRSYHVDLTPSSTNAVWQFLRNSS
jgi:hypothetical protein